MPTLELAKAGQSEVSEPKPYRAIAVGDGELVLQRCADGACAHLGERGCMIYEHRPSACRSFDCRVFSAMGLVEYCDPNHRIPDWEFAEDERGEH